MVAPERVLANISFPFDLIILSNPQEPFNNMAIVIRRVCGQTLARVRVSQT